MKTFSELHQIAWKTATSRWFFRQLYTFVLFMILSGAVLIPLLNFYAENGIQTWGDFAEMQMRMKAGGLDIAVASSQQFWSMTWASAFLSFVEYLVKGIALFGLMSVALKAVRDEKGGWIGAAFGGFRIPLDVVWLNLLLSLRVFLWALLFVIPGIIALFRYSMAWYVKADRPELSASECLAESSRLTDGHKFRLFLYGLSYICWYLMAGFAFVTVNRLGGADSPLGLFSYFAAFGMMLFAVVYALFFGNAAFYEELRKISGQTAEPSATVSET